MEMKPELLTFNNPVLYLYVSSTCILILKMLSLGIIIPLIRTIKKIPGSPEDAKFLQANMKDIDTRKEYLERVRRSHYNDLENIPFFLLIGLVYVLTDPPAGPAKILFRVYAAARVIHTAAYITKITFIVQSKNYGIFTFL
ncbi:uncharacterized protein TRIADDRAFT_53118 [Trichoplax adhaerens]|uniref:Microsomal glutathione S-transferase 1 n=1 Tax=Trichoplax adhaerens TaxID=10228 RepID=B3RNC8_TRIAD|nr:hypothetical protein TRIADDRAFT_53118 [Trichoplax adhaerens]EDV27431.1 hypothetical protein TRIADDRAFT_53118 [Trichoplax adhaerens]|eukprot:XP_002109265.1 hypothetical protein TRIADDRAFT_53118 [Trichoplax adhaerens]